MKLRWGSELLSKYSCMYLEYIATIPKNEWIWYYIKNFLEPWKGAGEGEGLGFTAK
jgi:hypothetical protein